mgnify:CR=1 FL=1
MKKNMIIALALVGAGVFLWQKNKKEGLESKMLGFSQACGCGK